MRVCIFGTFDSKGAFFLRLASRAQAAGHEVTCVNLGTSPYKAPPDIHLIETFDSQCKTPQVKTSASDTQATLDKMQMEGLKTIKRVHIELKLDALLTAGGSKGTSIAMEILKSFPEIPVKICISTMASMESMPGVQFIPSITDIQGLNLILKAVADYAVRFLCGDVEDLHSIALSDSSHPIEGGAHAIMSFLFKLITMSKLLLNAEKRIAVTMFGNTTPCVDVCMRKFTRENMEVMVFHAVGTGGEVMARLVMLGAFAAVLDVTTSELADLFCQGPLYATRERFLAPGKKGVPHIIVPGCIDMINYNRGCIPQERLTHAVCDWGPFSLSRTNVDDNAKMGAFIAYVANQATVPVEIFLPETFSLIGNRDGVFYLPEADASFCDALLRNVDARIPVKKFAGNINDPEFADMVSDATMRLVASTNESRTRLYCHESCTKSTVEVLAKLRQKILKGHPIMGCGAGNGLNACAEEAGGADLIIVYNSGYFRTHGISSLAGLMPYGNANDITFSIGNFVLNTVKATPVLAGLCATDPAWDMQKLLNEVRRRGFVGVQNFPTVGLIDQGSHFRLCLEETGLGYDKEVTMIRMAHQMGLLTTPYVFNEEQARAMSEAGADIVVVHLGLTVSSVHGAQKGICTLEEAPSRVQAIVDAINRDDVIVLAHGGPLNSSDTFNYVAQRVPRVQGFYGASAIERVPVFNAIKQELHDYVRNKSAV